jgi:hypothetical protein
MKSIGLPKNVIYACLAETIVLALEGRFEVFTIGRDTEWEKVKEIYKLGIKHGMKLAAISGVKGVYSDEDIAKVVALAKKARLTWKGAQAAAPSEVRTEEGGGKEDRGEEDRGEEAVVAEKPWRRTWRRRPRRRSLRQKKAPQRRAAGRAEETRIKAKAPAKKASPP